MELIRAKYRVVPGARSFGPMCKEYEADSAAHALALYEADVPDQKQCRQLLVECIRSAVKEQAHVQVGWRGLRVFMWPDERLVLEGRFGGPWLSPKQTACCGRPPIGDAVAIALAQKEAREHLLEGQCQCGIYAYHDAYSSEIDPRYEAVAQVLGWGVVGIRSKGFRAEHTRVEAVWVPDQLVMEVVGAKGRVSRCAPAVPIVQAPPDLIDWLRAMWPEVKWFSGMPGKEAQRWEPSIDAPGRRV